MNWRAFSMLGMALEVVFAEQDRQDPISRGA